MDSYYLQHMFFLLYVHIGAIIPFKINVVKYDLIRNIFSIQSISGYSSVYLENLFLS